MIARLQKAMKEKDGGFTLVELIVVVVIIGVLAAIAVPVFLNQSQKAKENADLATIAMARTALASYVADKGAAAEEHPLPATLAPYGFPSTAVPLTVNVDGANGAFFVEQLTANSASHKQCNATESRKPNCFNW